MASASKVNGYWLFIQEQLKIRPDLAQVPKEQLMGKCAPLWDALTQEKKQVYKNRAREHNDNQNGGRGSNAGKDPSERQSMILEITRLHSKYRQGFFLADVHAWCQVTVEGMNGNGMSTKALLAEVAVIKVNLGETASERGVLREDFFHALIPPTDSPGLAYEIQKRSQHKEYGHYLTPPNPSDRELSFQSARDVARALKSYLTSDQAWDFEGPDDKHPIIYTMPGRREEVSTGLSYLFESIGFAFEDRFLLGDLPQLLASSLKTSRSDCAGHLSDVLMYDYGGVPNVMCEEHVKKRVSSSMSCALAGARIYAFLFLDKLSDHEEKKRVHFKE